MSTELRAASWLCRLAAHLVSRSDRRTGSPLPRSISQLPFLAGPVAFPLPALLNPPPVRGVLLLEGLGFDGLAELELLEKTFSV